METQAEKKTCMEYLQEAEYLRMTQFAGEHYFCGEHAKAKENFMKDRGSYFSWRKLKGKCLNTESNDFK